METTLELRWVKANEVHMDKSKTLVVEGGILGLPFRDSEYLLQQKWVDEGGKIEWRNILVEFNPE